MSQRRYSFEEQEPSPSRANRQPQPQPQPQLQPQLQQQSQQQSYDYQDQLSRYHSSPQRPAAQQHPSYDRSSPPRSQANITSPRNLPQTTISVPYQQYPEQAHSPTRSPRTQPASPLAHPDSAFTRLRAARRYSNSKGQTQQAYADAVTPVAHPPSPPLHRDAEGRIWGRELGYTNSGYSNITTGADNFGEQAAGGLSGVAMSVADQHARESGLEAMRHTPGYDHDEMHMQNYPRDYQDSPYEQHQPHYQGHPAYNEHPYHEPPYQGQPPHPGPSPYDAPTYQQHHPQESPFADPYTRPQHRQDHSQASLTPLGAAAFPPGMSTPQSRSIASRSPPHSFVNDPYSDNPYNDSHRYSRNLDPSLATDFDPNLIEDDGDDGLEYRREHRNSKLSLGHHSNKAAPAAASGGIIGTLGGLVGRGPQYDAVQNATPGIAGPTAYGGVHDYDLGNGPEKSAWLNKQQKGNKKLWWIGSIVVVLIILGAVGGGVAYALLHKKSSSSSSGSGQSASSDTATNGDLDKNSPEIQALLNNKNLHKVFPGIDYTPMYTQYPGCLTYPASQNNVTRDLAVLSQLTNTIRLYGTDCNQTELLLHSISQLGLKDTIKVWMGVWQDTNATTNARQLAQMYDIFDKYGSDPFVGVIIGNEVLFRQDMTETELAAVITGVRSNLTSKGIEVAVASSDLGDNWTAAFASVVDYIMANIHPFFAGVTAEEAASWTYDFWTGHDTILSTNSSKNIISETGWPSAGGTDCGGAATCTQGSVAGITEMNTFMDTWVCDALNNGTNYFWFEAFDEPWKIQFDTPGKAWEDQWGLMDVNRNLKPGVQIPDCGGKTV